MRSSQFVSSYPVAVFRGVPSWFRAACRSASRGGRYGYFGVGRSFAESIGQLVPLNLEFDQWGDEVEQFAALFDAEDETAIWHWFEQRFPKLAARIPPQRRESFIDGMREVHGDAGISA